MGTFEKHTMEEGTFELQRSGLSCATAIGWVTLSKLYDLLASFLALHIAATGTMGREHTVSRFPRSCLVPHFPSFPPGQRILRSPAAESQMEARGL